MHVAVVGSGKMGSAIFRALANSPLEAATLYSRREEDAKEQERKFLKGLERARRRGTLTESRFHSKKKNFVFTDRLTDLAPADLVIEAVLEDYELKSALLAELESIVGRETLLTTNTSIISVEKLASSLKHPERFCGLHFFHPVLMIRLVEIIKWSGTSADVVERLVAFCKGFERNPIVVGDAPGSAINSILAYYYVEGLYLLDEGRALPSVVDEIAKQHFYLGPCESMDVIGIDFLVKGLEIFLGADGLFSETSRRQAEIISSLGSIPRRFRPPHLLSALLSSNRLGKRVSEGIFRYEKDSPADEAPEFYLAPGMKCSSDGGSTKDWLATRLLYSVFNGSLDVLSRSASSWSDLDFGIKEVLLMKEGPFSMMRSLGEAEVRKNFALLAEHAGVRFVRTEFPKYEPHPVKS